MISILDGRYKLFQDDRIHEFYLSDIKKKKPITIRTYIYFNISVYNCIDIKHSIKSIWMYIVNKYENLN